MSIYRDFAASGALIAYGPNLDVVYRRAAVYVDKLMKGAPAVSLPVEQPVKLYSCDQRQDREGTWPRDFRLDIGPRRRSNRVKGRCPLLAQSGHRLVRCTCLLLTQSGHGLVCLR